MVSFCQYIPSLVRGLFAGSRLQHMYLLLRWYVELYDLKSELMLIRLRLIHDRVGIEATIVLMKIYGPATIGVHNKHIRPHRNEDQAAGAFGR